MAPAKAGYVLGTDCDPGYVLQFTHPASFHLRVPKTALDAFKAQEKNGL
jgi:hypothetical protein